MQIPSLNGNWVDLVIIIFLIIFIGQGIGRGFLVNLIDLSGFIISFVLAFKFYPFVSKLLVANFQLPIGISNALGFILMGFAAETVFFFLARIFYQLIPKKITHSRINKSLGILPAIFNGLLVVTFFLLVVVATPTAPKIKKAIFASRLGAPLVSRTQEFEHDLAEVFGEAILDTLSFITIQPSSQERINLQFKITSLTYDESSETKMVELVNKEREQLGFKKLTVDEKVREVARLHAKDMFEKGYFSHINLSGESPFDRLEEGGVSFMAAGENLAFAPETELAHQGLMKSPGHRANILSSEFGKIGVGVIDGGVYGKMFVQLFTD